MTNFRSSIVFLAACLLVSLRLAPAAAQPLDPDTRQQRDRLQREFVEAFNGRDLAAAESSLRKWIELRPGEFTPVYNLACVQGLRGEAEEGAATLRRAVELGFMDLRVMERDGNLAPVRRTQAYRDLLAEWPELLDRVIDARLERTRKGLRGYTIEKDPELRLGYSVGFAPSSFAAAKEEIARLARWWSTEVLPDGVQAVERGDDGRPADPWVLVLLPSQSDFRSWADKNFARAGALSTIGGIYDHDRKELVAGDLGASFRHEFLHVLHWRHNARLDQVHAIWVQEGLCSLVEDVRVEPDGRLVPVPSWRTNSIKRRAQGSSKVSLDFLMKLSREKFSGDAPLANYALARAAFLFLYDRGRLRAWYASYCETFAQDPSGRAAFEAALGQPLAQTEKDFRAWLRKLPEVAEESRPGSATLPVAVISSAGDGLLVDSTLRSVRAIMPRDVITAIDGKPVRDLNEYARILGEYKVGDEVEVTFRRRNATASVRLQLIARE